MTVVQADMTDTDMAVQSKEHMPPIIMASHAIHRFAELDEVAAVIAFVAGPQAGFITGTAIDVNDGFTA